MTEKTIGIIGGMGPEATLDLYREIIRATPAQRDQDHLRVIIDSNPKIPDRTPAIIGDGENPVSAMVMSCRLLERAGADFCIIPCISAHYFIEELRAQINLPILSAFDAVCTHITDHHPNIRTIGLLSTSGTVQGGRFALRLAEGGIATILPEPDVQKRIMDAIYRIKASQDPVERAKSKAILISAAEHVINRGAQGIIAGCTEIPLELKPRDLAQPLFNPLEILARAAVDRATDRR